MRIEPENRPGDKFDDLERDMKKSRTVCRLGPAYHLWDREPKIL